MVDRALIREVRAFTKNDGTRPTRRVIRQKLAQCRDAMSVPGIRSTFFAVAKEHDRAAVALILAYTLIYRARELGKWKFGWAQEILEATNLPGLDPADFAIHDGLDASRICEYAGCFIRMSEE